MEPCLLALDTSTETMALALVGPRGRWAVNEPGGAAASAHLVPAVQALLGAAGLRLADLQAIGFGAGPGAFTGLRTACAVAQGLALGSGRPVLPLDSLMLVAEAAWPDGAGADAQALHWVAMDARMDEVYAAAYRYLGQAGYAGHTVGAAGAQADPSGQAGAGWQVVVAPALYTLPALRAAWEAAAPARIAGNALAVFGSRLPAGMAEQAAPEHDRGAALGRLVGQAWRQGGAIDPALALPLYLRDKVALTTDERARAKGA